MKTLQKIEEKFENVATKSFVEEGLVTVELQIILHKYLRGGWGKEWGEALGEN